MKVQGNYMSRYINEFTTTKTPDEVGRIIMDFMNVNGFKAYNYKNEQCFKKGMGILTGPQFLKVLMKENIIHIEGWIKLALLPGVYLGEMGTKGFYGIIPKKMLQLNIDILERVLK